MGSFKKQIQQNIDLITLPEFLIVERVKLRACWRLSSASRVSLASYVGVCVCDPAPQNILTPEKKLLGTV